MLVTITIKIGKYQKTLSDLTLTQAANILDYMDGNTPSGRHKLYRLFEAEFEEYNKTALLKATITTPVPSLISKLRGVR